MGMILYSAYIIFFLAVASVEKAGFCSVFIAQTIFPKKQF
jgi:hypothetical protein